MRLEVRYVKGVRGRLEPRGLVLIAETEKESEIIDEVLGDKVGEEGLICSGEFEVRLSDGYAEHYIYIKTPKR